MVVLASSLMVLLVAAAILYPFARRKQAMGELEEGSRQAELGYRWDGIVAGLRDADMERAIGTLPEPEYQWVRQRYMAEAAVVLRAFDLEQQQEERLLASLEDTLRQARQRSLGDDNGAAGASPERRFSDG